MACRGSGQLDSCLLAVLDVLLQYSKLLAQLLDLALQCCIAWVVLPLS